MNAIRLSKQKILFGLLLVMSACSGKDKGDDAAPAASATSLTVTGSIKSVAGIQSEMNQWVVALVNTDSGVTRLGVVNAAGNYSIENVDKDQPYSIVILDPQFRLSAVLSYAGEAGGQVRQTFEINAEQLPTLVHNGPICQFSDSTNISWQGSWATDTDGDLIPDGQETALLADGDTDEDGVANTEDSDIDGDGILNWFDSDDDNDGLPDVFDADSDGDGSDDLNQGRGELFFPDDLQYTAVQVVQDVEDDGSLSTELLLTTKLWDTVPTAITVRGASGLFEEAVAIRTDPTTAAESTTAWDLSLVDDGANEDGAADDRTYARRIRLAGSKLPKNKQAIFFQFSVEQNGETLTNEFPFTFPDVVAGAITGAYNAETRTVTLSGTPFGTVTQYKWSVHVYDSNGIKVFASAPVDGSTTSSYVLPDGVIESGETYSARIIATTPERIPSFPSWVIRSANFNL